jgi:hypothetical protein
MRRLLVAAVFATLSFAALALPSIDEVQSEVRQGRWAHAEEMMREVVAAKPGSARAHYVYAEILAHDARFDRAREEAAQARRLDPTLKFTDAAKFSAFEQLLEREHAAAQRPAAVTAATPAPARPVFQPQAAAAPVSGSGSGLPSWVWIVGLAVVAWLGWRMFAARRQAVVPALPAWSGSPQGGGVMGATPGMGGPGYGMGAPAAGSGLLGTGLAVAGGVAAGMLAEKLLSDHGSSPAPGMAPSLAGGAAAGGFDTSALDDPAATELEQRPVDFGQGDGWDGGGGADSSDGGSDGGW